MDSYDVVVIGAGPAGYVAAIRCAQLGLKTACVEEWINKQGKPALGGTCLNVGCIPSKALLDSSEHYQDILHGTQTHGIRISNLELDVPEMIDRKDEIVSTLTSGVEGLFKKNKVTWLKGHGSLQSHNEVLVRDHKGKESVVTAENIVLATGSTPRYLDAIPVDHETIVDSSAALNFDHVPKRLGIIGAGVIGVELGSVWGRLGSEVVLLEAMDQFLFFVDEQIGNEAHREFERQGLDIRLGARVSSATTGPTGVEVVYQDTNGEHTIEFDKLVVAVGRKPHTKGLDLQNADVLTDERGFIHVDSTCTTSMPHIYAVGDVVRGPMLAHKGSEEGIMVAECIAGQKPHLNYDTIPWVVYTYPEIAWVGKTEKQLHAEAKEYKVGTFPLTANGRARAMNATTGMVKILADKKTDTILGVHIFAPTASEMIAEAVVAMEFKASSEDLARIVHAHPTISEAVHEAALAVDNRPLHI